LGPESRRIEEGRDLTFLRSRGRRVKKGKKPQKKKKNNNRGASQTESHGELPGGQRLPTKWSFLLQFTTVGGRGKTLVKEEVLP